MTDVDAVGDEADPGLAMWGGRYALTWGCLLLQIQDDD
jgi:hypothetical protein